MNVREPVIREVITEVIRTADAPQAIGPYSQAIAVRGGDQEGRKGGAILALLLTAWKAFARGHGISSIEPDDLRSSIAR